MTMIMKHWLATRKQKKKKRFENSKAIGLVGIRVKAFVPFATKEKQRERIVEEIDNFRCPECGGICFDKEDALKIVQNPPRQTRKHQLK